MPLPSSGDGRLLGQKSRKIKSTQFASGRTDPSKILADSKKDNPNKNRKSKNPFNQTNEMTEISRNLHYIIDHHRTLNINEPSIFNYDNVSSTHTIIHPNDVLMSDNSHYTTNNNLIVNANGLDNIVAEPGISLPNSQTVAYQPTVPGHIHTNSSSVEHLKRFEDNFIGTPVIVVEH